MKAVRPTRLDEAGRDHDLLVLCDDLAEDSRTRIEAAWPGIQPAIEKAGHAFGKWRCFESPLSERGMRTILDTDRARVPGKPARDMLDEAKPAGPTCGVELDGRWNV